MFQELLQIMLNNFNLVNLNFRCLIETHRKPSTSFLVRKRKGDQHQVGVGGTGVQSESVSVFSEEEGQRIGAGLVFFIGVCDGVVVVNVDREEAACGL